MLQRAPGEKVFAVVGVRLDREQAACFQLGWPGAMGRKVLYGATADEVAVAVSPFAIGIGRAADALGSVLAGWRIAADLY